MPAAGEAHRRSAGGPVEGLGDRRPPVDDDRLLALVGHGEAADVEDLPHVAVAGGPVDAPEAEAGVAELELAQPGDDRVPDDVALEAGLLGAAPADLDHRAQARGRLRAASRHSYAWSMYACSASRSGWRANRPRSLSGEQTMLPV